MRKIEQRDLHTDLGRILESTTDIRDIATLRLDLARQLEEDAQGVLDNLHEEYTKAQTKLNEAKAKRLYWESQEAKLEFLEAAEDRAAVDEDGIKIPEDPVLKESEEEHKFHTFNVEDFPEVQTPSNSASTSHATYFAVAQREGLKKSHLYQLILRAGESALGTTDGTLFVVVDSPPDWTEGQDPVPHWKVGVAFVAPPNMSKVEFMRVWSDRINRALDIWDGAS